MDELELLLFFLFIYLTCRFLRRWYRALRVGWPPQRTMLPRRVLALLPPAAFIILFFTLRFLAAFDVVDSPLFILFYLLMGFSWLYGGVLLLILFFDLHWMDDALHRNNRAALAAVSGGFLGLTLIFGGANIGDGPGWWCVVYAGLLGVTAWFGLGMVANALTGVLERITVGRDLRCGIRLGCYLLASGILLARACGGDWTSASMTVLEFLDGWPVLPLTLLMVLVERYCLRREGRETGGERNGGYLAPVAVGAAYTAFAIVSVILLPPFPQNPFYRDMAAILLGTGL